MKNIMQINFLNENCFFFHKTLKLNCKQLLRQMNFYNNKKFQCVEKLLFISFYCLCFFLFFRNNYCCLYRFYTSLLPQYLATKDWYASTKRVGWIEHRRSFIIVSKARGMFYIYVLYMIKK